ncbi:hypothetical protein BHYA_0119g00110 [Botrytis hyacinthi]|uniref:Tr-type G domain-containing protein n=1 Tax=Botrytis hyacinthi TaxID=278943 RepID=A0A4Z1GPU8_9HELO|nr:hypothetical protein BHYA_0119g00110 [Botrytis hyacinthi]
MFIGPPGAGVATAIGCMLFQFGGIPMNMMELFHREKITRYEEVPDKLAALGISPSFNIPGYRIEILDSSSEEKADCTILVTSPDVSWENDMTSTIAMGASDKMIVLVNKMDMYESGEAFQKIEKEILDYFISLGKDVTRVLIVPVSSASEANYVEEPLRSSWYNENSMGSATVLSALTSVLA